MSVPDYSNIVNAVKTNGNYNLETHDGCGIFCEAVVKALHSADPNFGHLKKTGAQNNYNGHALDVTLYRATGQTVDFVYSGGDPGAHPSWSVNEGDNYPADQFWIDPGGSVPVSPVSPSNPSENPNKDGRDMSQSEFQHFSREFDVADAGAIGSMQDKLDAILLALKSTSSVSTPSPIIPTEEMEAVLLPLIEQALDTVIQNYNINIPYIGAVKITKKA